MVLDKTQLNEENISSIFASMTRLLFDQLPVPINFVDADGRVIAINKAFLEFLNIDLEDIHQKRIADIDPTVRLPVVIKTGKAELGQRHKFKDGREVIVHRIPIFYEDKIIGGVGIILIDDLSYFYKQAIETDKLKELETIKISRAKDIYKAKYNFDHILTASELKKQCKRRAKNYSATDMTVLITGESGVGKELFAHSIHQESKRNQGPFITVNCAAIPESLLESELFGYSQGAFTGAKKTGQQGKFELANGGTIFLDEIGEMPLNTQAKILRVLQEKEVRRIGDSKNIPLDIRVIAATNAKLENAITEGKFRSDLYYRLNVLNLEIPGLRETPEDIPLLINHFTTLMFQEFGLYKKFPKKVVELLQAYEWPGNVRELKNIVERMTVNAENNEVSRSDVPKYVMAHKSVSNLNNKKDYAQDEVGSLKETLYNVEKNIILDTLKSCKYNKAKTANKLGIPRMTLYRKLKSYGIEDKNE
ncbi:sigma 54-interacting transcriptional regulator [Serpentinicella sp. ANB-PHB4]|uniref:sigma-54 interaction domain-containing protein n=1 Tax=Serpentinicella sp. ANB-PHB4 TaxID=3074076 RepID=UPI002858E4DD|nr:sigma 54-interacting transcriptional regulator [Serpentinicella sp. ANB-PHB4]MDR5658609.1 sigma 54-interacting transcriptional regulator [Serpentinicella sp. ANB-PHB4]